jgi:hypothetical protein
MSVSLRRESARHEREALPAIHDKAASLAVAILRCNKQQIAKDVFAARCCCGAMLLRCDAAFRRRKPAGPLAWSGRTNLHSQSCNSAKKPSAAQLERSKTLKEIQINEQQINEGNVEKPKLGAIIRAMASLPKKRSVSGRTALDSVLDEAALGAMAIKHR